MIKVKNVEKSREPCVPGAGVPSNKVTKFSQNVTPHLNQVLMAGRCLKCLQNMTTNTLSILKRYTTKHDITNWPSSFVYFFSGELKFKKVCLECLKYNWI